MTVTTARLSELRTRLIGLGRRRLFERWVTGWSGLVVAIVVALVLAFLVDYSLRLRRIERLASLLMVCGATLWAFRKLTRPYLTGRESLGEIALLVERRQKIDSDLVAALEFDGQLAGRVAADVTSSGPDDRSGGAKTVGSPQLRAAVVDYVADFARTVNVADGENSQPMRRRLGWAAGLIALAAVIGFLFPGHAKAFFNRFLLGGQHYPSRTRIAEFRVNDASAVRNGVAIELAAVPEGAAVRFAVRLDGVLPELVELRIANDASTRSTLLLSRLAESNAAESVQPDNGCWYAAEIDHLAEDLWLELVAGDASTDPIRLRVSPRPVLVVELRSTPPDYARGLAATQDEAAAAGSARQIAVLEGSRVDLTVSCRNQELASVTMHRGEEAVELKRLDGATPQWGLPNPAASPLARVMEPLAFEIDAKNRDGVSPARRVPVLVRLLADRIPRVVAAVVTERVLPTARPSIVYGATDDLALGELKLSWQVRRTDGTVVDGTKSLRTRTGDSIETTWRGKSNFDLRPLGLVAGEEVRVTLEAVDYRGGQPGKASSGEPIVFQVTDESGILSGLAEADERTARQLDQIIERQLGLGGSP